MAPSSQPGSTHSSDQLSLLATHQMRGRLGGHAARWKPTWKGATRSSFPLKPRVAPQKCGRLFDGTGKSAPAAGEPAAAFVLGGGLTRLFCSLLIPCVAAIALSGLFTVGRSPEKRYRMIIYWFVVIVVGLIGAVLSWGWCSFWPPLGAPPTTFSSVSRSLATCLWVDQMCSLEYLAVSRDHSLPPSRGALDEGGLNCWALMPRLGKPLGDSTAS